MPALNTSVGTLANTSLVRRLGHGRIRQFSSVRRRRCASTVLRSIPPLNSWPGTPANTVSWYTGENGTDPARGTAVAGIDQSISVQYGARANESAFVAQLKSIAVYAAITTNAANPNANGQLTALNSRIVDNLAVHPGTQSIQDIQADFAGAQSAIATAKDRQTQTGSIAQVDAGFDPGHQRQ